METHKFDELIKKYLNVRYCFSFWKGRIAFYAILKAIGIGPGDEVILPGFTCVVVANAIIYTGAKPVYVDIDPLTYNINVEKVKDVISARTKAIITQNTFGLSPDLDDLIKLANNYGIQVIEDCAHGFGGTYKDRKNGTVAHASFFSTQWSKPFSTGLGGFAITSDKNIGNKLKMIHYRYCEPSVLQKINMLIQINFYNFFMYPSIYWPAIKFYRFLSQNGWVTGSSSREELIFPRKPEGFELKFSSIQAKKGIKELLNLRKNIDHRCKIAGIYDQIMDEIVLSKPYQPEYTKHTFLRYPLLVRNKEKVLQYAENNRIEMGDWFLSPLHPILGDLSPWKYIHGSCPQAEKICRQIVNLPTHEKINEKYVEKIRIFLKLMKKQEIL